MATSPFSTATNFLKADSSLSPQQWISFLPHISQKVQSNLLIFFLSHFLPIPPSLSGICEQDPLTHPYPCLWKFTPVSLLSGVPVHVTQWLVFHFLHSSGQNLFQVGFLGCGESSSGKSIYCAYKRIWVWVARTQMSNRI